ncbi:hypothetical protein NLJ89_g2350 [Agrocybe chaxingu]|uniref:Uncharacterized protein n=1 Tax=Agrocybe chaxingu TaxID=84603 RepID=A0A9W8MWJ7_9AGAR|nr:hypothetical protein NLJ89_g2350 [Agrocybe chaxingu]
MDEGCSRLGTSLNPSQSYHSATSISPLSILSNVAASTPRVFPGKPQDNSQHRQSNIPAESDKENLSSVPPVPITAPVPVLYACLGKEALKSILSIGVEEEERTLEEPTPQVHMFTENTNIAHSSAIIHTTYEGHFMGSNAEVPQEMAAVMARPAATTQRNPVSTTQKATPIAIRPISPSTLMALTEPCLMEWCTLPIKEDAETETAFRVSEEARYQLALGQSFYAYNRSTVEQSGPNLWGY